ncbi:MAG: cell division protein FtsW [Finegoldia magna]|uniref:AbrB/MazE/SpoVT family DNA-binding domain-containing protein n=1 Tax=Finegoldia magna TaxID=1260 RepID=UPI0026E9FE6B|nr:cell division protein FtsW [Finegoldia magna]MBS5776428.1 cell division protein FtsW [Finegoldia magna]MDU2575578.1 cell division protein FtsW [Finegoldia magna]MDU3805814.1 cell division protein FtsW [Finegoldia magna]MDU7479308.1 cell division protein FtsW [Finegoldia magna]
MKIKLHKCGNSHVLQIPRSILDALSWKDNDILDLKIKDNKLIIENSSNDEMNIEDLFEDFNGKYSKEDIDWGKMTGKEVW